MAEVAFLLGSSRVLRPSDARCRAEEERAGEHSGNRKKFNEPTHDCVSSSERRRYRLLTRKACTHASLSRQSYFGGGGALMWPS